MYSIEHQANRRQNDAVVQKSFRRCYRCEEELNLSLLRNMIEFVNGERVNEAQLEMRNRALSPPSTVSLPPLEPNLSDTSSTSSKSSQSTNSFSSSTSTAASHSKLSFYTPSTSSGKSSVGSSIILPTWKPLEPVTSNTVAFASRTFNYGNSHMESVSSLRSCIGGDLYEQGGRNGFVAAGKVAESGGSVENGGSGRGKIVREGAKELNVVWQKASYKNATKVKTTIRSRRLAGRKEVVGRRMRFVYDAAFDLKGYAYADESSDSEDEEDEDDVRATRARVAEMVLRGKERAESLHKSWMLTGKWTEN